MIYMIYHECENWRPSVWLNRKKLDQPSEMQVKHVKTAYSKLLQHPEVTETEQITKGYAFGNLLRRKNAFYQQINSLLSMYPQIFQK